MTIQIQGISLTSIGQLRQYLEGFLWGDNYEPIRFRKTHIRQMLEVTRQTESELADKTNAIVFALHSCEKCWGKTEVFCKTCEHLTKTLQG